MWRWGVLNSRPENDSQAILQDLEHSEGLVVIRKECTKSNDYGLSFFRCYAGVSAAPDPIDMTFRAGDRILPAETVALAYAKAKPRSFT